MESRKQSSRLPPIPHVGLVLIVASTIRHLDSDEPLPLVEVSRHPVLLERPEVEFVAVLLRQRYEQTFVLKAPPYLAAAKDDVPEENTTLLGSMKPG